MNRKLKIRTIIYCALAVFCEPSLALAKDTRVVISIDGGGIRGIIPAMVLESLEDRLGCHLTQVVDVFAGSSTGGILALGLNVPNEAGAPKYKARDLVNLYETQGKTIFSGKRWSSVGGYFGPLFSNTGMQKVFFNYFGETLLSEAIKEVFITSYDLDRADPYFFANSRVQTEGDMHEFKLRDVAGATARAQTYLEPEKIINIKGEFFNLIDGGNVENNPAELAYYHAKTLYPDDDFLVISMGTGDTRAAIQTGGFMSGGKLDWAKKTIDLQMGVQSELVNWRMNQLLPDVGKDDRYVRINKRLTYEEADLDLANVQESNVKKLRSIGAHIVEGFSHTLDNLVFRLKGIMMQRQQAANAQRETELTESVDGRQNCGSSIKLSADESAFLPAN